MLIRMLGPLPKAIHSQRKSLLNRFKTLKREQHGGTYSLQVVQHNYDLHSNIPPARSYVPGRARRVPLFFIFAYEHLLNTNLVDARKGTCLAYELIKVCL